MPVWPLERVGVSLFALVAIICAIIAGAVIWLMLTDPVTVATAVNQGQVSPFAMELAQVILNALRGLLSYL
ncbi:MAG TPA: hypothetical protein VIC33_06935 [Vicinamibacterales bacterium]|jgi:hypothetical protein